MAYFSKSQRALVPSSLRKWAGYVKSNGVINLILAIIADIVLLCTLHMENEWWILLVVLFGGILLWGINLLVATVLAATAEMTEAAYNFNEREYKTRKEQIKQKEATQKNQQDEAHKAQLEARNTQIEKLNLPTAENPQKPEPAPQKPEPAPQKPEPAPQKPEPAPQKPATPPQKPAEIRMQWGENIPKKKAAVPKYVFKGTQATCPFCKNIMEISDSAKSRGQAFCDECCKSFNLTKDVETTAEQIEEAKKKAQQQQEAKVAEEKRLQEEKEQKMIFLPQHKKASP